MYYYSTISQWKGAIYWQNMSKLPLLMQIYLELMDRVLNDQLAVTI